MIKLLNLLKENTVYRGAKSPEFSKGDFNGIWVSPIKKIAGQYVGNNESLIWEYELDPNIKLLNVQSNAGRKVEEFFIKEYPELEDVVNQDGDFLELWMFPPEELSIMLKEMGFDGYVNGSDYFIVNLNKIQHKK